MSVRALAAAVAPGLLLALALWAGHAPAQTNVCRGGSHTGSASISCTEAAGSSADIVIDPGSVNIPRIDAVHRGSGDTTVRVKPGATLTGSGGRSVSIQVRGSGDGVLGITGGSLSGQVAVGGQSASTGNISASMSGGSLSGTFNTSKIGGSGNTSIVVSGDAAIETTGGTWNYGLYSQHTGAGNVSIRMTGGSVETTGTNSYGVLALSSGTGASDITVVLEGGAIRTRGGGSFGVTSYGVFMERSNGSGNHSFRMSGGSIVTEQDNAHGVVGLFPALAAGDTGSVSMTGGSIVAEGLGAQGIWMNSLNLGSADMTTAAPAEIESPFYVGMEGRLTENASATGRIVVTHGGAVEARDVGVLAWAARSSGHTMGSGATTANDAARTTPMIHVTSSGTVTVGAPVTEAFIRARIAGDGGLSTLEEAVLTAITDNDSSALTTALAALPASYDAAWKAEAEDLRRKRAAVTAAATGNGPLAHAAAEGILGLSRAGVRAMARSWTPIVDHIRGSDALSTAERTALTAVLTGDSSGLTTALNGLTGATYTTAWKNTVRQHAATYNAGDIQVDITGGSITAEGNGVEALYTVPHDSNGDIAVTVSAGARVTGGARGIYVRGAGVTAGARNQAVTVHGAAMGGTGAGVHVVGGGAVTVGASGEVGTVGAAPSGIGILGDGGGDLTATVSGTVTGDIRVNGGGDLAATVKDGGTVTGDLRVGGSGALTATVEAGGAVEGTIRDPQASFTVSGRVGRVLYASGGTVTVAGGAKLTGVGGVAAESTAGLLTVTVNDEGRVEGDIKSGGTLMATVNDGGVVTGTIEDPQASFTVGSGASIGRILYASGGTVTVAGGAKLTGVEGVAVESTASALTVTVNDEGRVEGDVKSGGTLMATVNDGCVVTGTIHNPQASFTVGSGASIGRILYASGGTVTVSGGAKLTGVEGVAVESTASALTVTVNDEGRVEGDIKSGGTLMATVNDGGVVTGTIEDPQASFTVGSGASIGRLLYASGGTVTVSGGAKLTGVEGVAVESTAGALAVTVNDEGRVEGDIKSGGTLMATVNDGGVVTGTIEDPQASFTVGSGASIGRLLYASGGTVTVSGGAKLTGVEGVAVESTAGALAVTVNDEGRVEGDIKSGGTLMATVDAGGVVTGTIEDPQASFTVAGSVGRVLHASGGTVTVSGGGRLTGVEGEALRSEAGDLALTVAGMGTVTGDVRALGDGDLEATVAGTLTGDVIEEGAGALSATVTGTVTGDVLGRGAGEHTVTVANGGTVTGTVHLAAASTVRVDGTAGRVRFDNGATVTVAGTGRLTGVEVEGRTEALRSEAGDLDLTVAGTVTGDVRALGDGDLSATVSGTVDGDLRAEGGGALTLNLMQGGTVTGTVHDPASPLTVAGTIGRLLYTNGATVTVAATGKLTGVEVEGRTEALRSEAGDLDLSVAGSVTGDVHALGDGDLDATISGTLTGDVFGLGAGEHTVTVANGGTVTGTVHLAASTVRVDGRAGRVRFDQGGTVTVGSTGWITGIEVDDRTEAIRNAAGDLVVSVAGRVAGDIIGLGDLPAKVTTEPGSTVAGSVEVAGAGSEVRVGGTVAGRVRFRRGGRVTVGPDGKVEGRVSSDEGELVAVVERKPEETEADAVERAFPAGEPVVDEGGTSTLLTRKEGEPPCPVPCPLGTEEADAPVYEARMRVYEALPSVVLGLNGLPGFRERMAAPRSAQGGWARVEALRGKWKAEASASGKESGVGLEHRHRRHGIQVGWAGALGEEALVGVSLHHRRGSAEVSEGGDLELSGTGAGMSGTWVREEVYVDVQAEMTGYEADLTSSRRGVLKKDVSGHGHALGVEAGRRLALERLPAGLVLTPRAGLVHSRVSVDAFSDAMGSRVTVDGARSLKGRVGVEAEVKVGRSPGSRVFGSVEVEHEFSTGRKVRVSGRELRSEADATWLHLGLDGAHTWNDGRYTLQGGMSYATSGGSHEFGGGVSLNLRF